jgi:hypothetical protein
MKISAMLSTLAVENDSEIPLINGDDKAMMCKLTSAKKFDLRVMAFNIAKLTEEERSRLYTSEGLDTAIVSYLLG